MTLTFLAGAGLAIVSWFLKDQDPWWSALLANMAVVVLLLIPGELLLAGVRNRVETVADTATRAELTADQAQQSAEATARSLDEVRQVLVDRQVDELEASIDRYRDIVKVPDRESLIGALRQATQEDLITSDGVRVPVWETDVHYRFVVSEAEPSLVVRLEQDDGTVLSESAWDVHTSPVDFYQALVSAVRAAGRDLGTGLNLPTQSVEELSAMLVEITRLRSQELAGHRQTLRRVIERRNGWYFTEENVLPVENLSYTIGVDRLHEPDWEEHLRNKGWYTAPDAIQFARRLYDSGAPRSSASSGGEA
ncbi:hypothetical protein [Agrococcus sp. KRD186]|uniref:hypothetical protein n=1 Tax=Agrococcus sp. KRD186 TaxID=2729730 RepID=UPI0019CFE39E|nr:hypothetical protein [Agrococcus sp. KRD186]